jgi:hypothetical protein
VAQRTPQEDIAKTVAHAVKAGVTVNDPFNENLTDTNRPTVTSFLDATDLFNFENQIATQQRAKANQNTVAASNPAEVSDNSMGTPTASQGPQGYFGDPTYSGAGFQGVGTSGYGAPANGDNGSSASAGGNNNGADYSGSADNGFAGDFGDGHADVAGQAGGYDGGWGWPVILDLNNDGNIRIIPLSHSTARFDIASTGSRQVLAWPGPEEGLFVYDRDGDRLISHKDEIAFKDYLATAKTDLEGLAWFDQLAQGGNADGVLDERDAAWSKFGIWRDADQDGETDAGELQMTGEGGLKSLNLTSDQQPRDAGPDAKIFGKGTFEYFDRDGIIQTADAYDVALQYEKEKSLANALYPTMDVNRRSLPPLVRRDGQELSRGEKVYPMMGYDENIYEPWPDWAVDRFLKHYPDQADKLVSSRR